MKKMFFIMLTFMIVIWVLIGCSTDCCEQQSSPKKTETKYTITFNNNDGIGEMNPMNVKFGETIQLISCTFTRVGYTFAHWNTQKDDSGTKYENNDSVKEYSSFLEATRDFENHVLDYLQRIRSEYEADFEENHNTKIK